MIFDLARKLRSHKIRIATFKESRVIYSERQDEGSLSFRKYLEKEVAKSVVEYEKTKKQLKCHYRNLVGTNDPMKILFERFNNDIFMIK
jgi:hypothetical protein